MEQTVQAAPAGVEASLLTVVVTDLVDSTRIVADLGDQSAHAALQRHDRLARDLLAEHHGREIDKSDGFLLLFEQPSEAVLFALRYHEALRALSLATGVQWRARVGIQLGELFVHENSADDIARGAKPLEVEGLAKPLAARLMSLAQGGQTLLGATAFDLAQRSEVVLPGQPLGWLAHGRYFVKGSEAPIEVFEVGVIGHAPLRPPPDGDKARREIGDDECDTLGWRPGPGVEVPQRAPWRLLRKLGAGGFGELWLGEHPATGGRRVFKFCHDAERVRSLKREVTVFRLLREALGDRDDIVRIIDWQFDVAPFFVEMDHVDGGDLLAWAERGGGLASVPLATRVELAAQVADALAAAHSVGVLHKDIKPGNILIRDGSDGPRALLTDFGIGIVTDRRQLMAHGITVAGLTDFLEIGTGGSQLYMAPETLQGRAATIQADIYALGVVLYELAAGAFKPLAPGWHRDIDDELLAHDIEAMVDGDPARRPASAARVAQELRALPQRREQLAAQRQAEAEAIATRTALARAQARRRWALGFAVALVIVLGAVSWSAWQTARARDEAELRRDQAEKLIGFMLDDLRERLTQVGRLDILDAVGGAAMTYFEAIPADQLEDADLAARSKALYQIGDVRVSQGNFDGAAEAMQESLQLANTLAARAPDDAQRQFDLAQSEYWVGYVAFKRRDYPTARTHFERYAEIARWLVARDPGNATWATELRYAYSNTGSVEEAMGDLEGATRSLEAALAATEASADPDTASGLADIASGHDKLGRVLEKRELFQQAIEHYRTDLALQQKRRQLAPKDAAAARDEAKAQYYYARDLFMTGDVAQASESVASAVRQLSAMVDADPSNASQRREFAFALLLAANIALARGETEQADMHLSTAATVVGAIGSTYPQLQAAYAWQSALRAASVGDQDAAIAAAHLTIDTVERLPHREEADLVIAADASSLLLSAAANTPEARAASEAAGALAMLQEYPAHSARIEAAQVQLLLALGRRGDARVIAEHLHTVGYREPYFVAACKTAGFSTERL